MLWLPTGESEVLMARLEPSDTAPAGRRVVVVYAPDVSYPTAAGGRETEESGSSLEALRATLSDGIVYVERRIRDLAATGTEPPRRFLVPARPPLQDLDTTLPETVTRQYGTALSQAMASLSVELGVEIEVVPLRERLDAALQEEEQAATPDCRLPESDSILSPPLAASCLTADNSRYLLWDRGLSGPGGRSANVTAAELHVAPSGLGPQPAFALLSADGLLHGTDGSAFWLQNGRGLGLLSQQGFVDGVDQALFWQQTLAPAAPWRSGSDFGYGFGSLGIGALRHSDGATTISVVMGLDRGDGQTRDDRVSTSFESLRLGFVGSYDRGLGYGGFSLLYGADGYGGGRSGGWPGGGRQGLITQFSALTATDGSALAGYGAATYRLSRGSLAFGPQLELRYLGLHTAGWADGAAASGRSLAGSAGLAAAGSFPLRSSTATPYLQAGVGDQLLPGLADDIGLPNVLQGFGPEPGRDLYGRLSGGIDLSLSDRMSASVAADSLLFGGRGTSITLGGSLAF